MVHSVECLMPYATLCGMPTTQYGMPTTLCGMPTTQCGMPTTPLLTKPSFGRSTARFKYFDHQQLSQFLARQRICSCGQPNTNTITSKNTNTNINITTKTNTNQMQKILLVG